MLGLAPALATAGLGSKAGWEVREGGEGGAILTPPSNLNSTRNNMEAICLQSIWAFSIESKVLNSCSPDSVAGVHFYLQESHMLLIARSPDILARLLRILD